MKFSSTLNLVFGTFLASSALSRKLDSFTCWSTSLGYPCCKDLNAKVEFEDNNGKWGVENGNWCGIIEREPYSGTDDCWSLPLGFPCCTQKNPKVEFEDNSGKWGVENGNWCGIRKPRKPSDCWALKLGYQCCSNPNTKVEYVDENGEWGAENDTWCGIIKATCNKAFEACGGSNYPDLVSNCCPEGYYCYKQSEYYHQCVPKPSARLNNKNNRLPKVPKSLPKVPKSLPKSTKSLPTTTPKASSKPSTKTLPVKN